MNWHRYFLNVASDASLDSKDPNTKVGAAVVANNEVISTGYNGFPSGFPDTPDNWSRPKKYDYVVHAELNAIIHAKTDLKGAKLYCTLQPCASCMKAIASSGIIEVYYQEERKDDIAEEIAKNCNIIVRQI